MSSSTSLDAQDQAVRRRALALERTLVGYFTRRAKRDVADILRSRKLIAKAAPKIDEELLKILLKFGLYQTNDAALRAATTTKGLKALIEPTDLLERLRASPMKVKIYEDFLARARVSARAIDRTTRELLNEQVRNILAQAAGEDPMPSVGEIARRISTRAFAKDPNDRVFAFSRSRAELIAHTEIRQAENIGRQEAYRAAGVEPKDEIWIAHSDGRSGERHHERMDGARRIKTGPHKDYFKNPTTGVYLRYPHDPGAPMSERARCRCGLGFDPL